MTLRDYCKTDCTELARLFYDTVHTVNAKDYSREQLDAWATGEVNLEAWNKSFQAHNTVVAEMDGQIVGFGDMDETGYLDRLYVHKDYQRRGVATAICDALEQNTKAAEFSTHASITARPFFEKRGYTVVKVQQVERRGILLTNFVMKKVREDGNDQ
ncbi:MAG: GNAT family N-acetyltransferase [Firmicutes bacterium]|nr:GNAT family N-acetyltransferase [Bacillota bacterium]MDY4222249.1 GNAT family N-acetyltransferase [Candidatus Faecousia sp.]MDY6161659.1 GNAT family N-acetyltransferase [Candidatus Faecousia sp.]